MKRTLRLSTLAGAMVAAVLLTSLAPVSPPEANAGPLYLPNGGLYYGGGYAPGYGGYSTYGYGPYGYSGYSGYGYSPYGNGGYVYAPREYVEPSHRSDGFGTGATYNGIIDHSYSGSRFFTGTYPPAYNPYGYGGYGPYGFRVQHDYGY
jgi:hypothetical protein